MELVLGIVGCPGGSRVASQDAETGSVERQLPEASGPLKSAEALEPQQAASGYENADLDPLEADTCSAASLPAAEQKLQAAAPQDHLLAAKQAAAGK